MAETIISINLESVKEKARQKKEEVDNVRIAVNEITGMVLTSESEENNDIKVAEQEFEELITYKGIPITVNPILPFGFFLVK